jgi:hypothetical protein
MGVVEMVDSNKVFQVSFTASCKNLKCKAPEEKCWDCLRTLIDGPIQEMFSYKCNLITTTNLSKKFGCSFLVSCKKPNCDEKVPRNVACCTANADKCELCLRTVVQKSIRDLQGFHVKEILVV